MTVGGGDVVSSVGGGDAAARGRALATVGGAAADPRRGRRSESIADKIAAELDAAFDAIGSSTDTVLVLAAEPEASKGLAHVLERANMRGTDIIA